MPINLNLPKKPGLFITGTDGSVGKTLIAGAIAKVLTGQGLKAGVFKPIATGCSQQWDGLINHETDFLADCANSNLPLTTITPVGFVTKAVPLVGTAREKKPIDFGVIANAYRQICEESDIVIIEGVGGVREPLTVEFDLLDLAVEFGLPVVIVAKPNEGTINHTLMTIDCVRATKLKIAGVVFNGYHVDTETVTTNTAPAVISQMGGVDILAEVPFDETVNIKQNDLGEIIIESLGNCDWQGLAQM